MAARESEPLSAAAAVCLPLSLVFTGAVILGMLLPWRPASGAACHDGTLLLLLVLLGLGLQAWAFATHLAVAECATLGAGLGLFTFLVLLAEISCWAGEAGFGLWFAWTASLGMMVMLLTLASVQPAPWSAAQRFNAPPFLRRRVVLVLTLIIAAVLGVLYWLLAVYQ